MISGLIFMMALGTSAADPTSVTQAFYRDYLSVPSKSTSQQYIAPETAALIKKANSYNRPGEAAVLDWDVWTGTQVQCFGATVSHAKIDSEKATVSVGVRCGLQSDRSANRPLTVILRRYSGSWKIYDLIYNDPEGKHLLRADVKRAIALASHR